MKIDKWKILIVLKNATLSLLIQLVQLKNCRTKINLKSLEPLEFCLEKKYYLTVIKEITITDSFLSLNKDIRGCQEESFDDCTTRIYRDVLLNECKCLPFQLGLSTEVRNSLH